MALSGFRRLLKTSLKAFKGDDLAIVKAREQLRSEFLRNKDVTDKKQLSELYMGIDEVIHKVSGLIQ